MLPCHVRFAGFRRLLCCGVSILLLVTFVSRSLQEVVFIDVPRVQAVVVSFVAAICTPFAVELSLSTFVADIIDRCISGCLPAEVLANCPRTI